MLMTLMQTYKVNIVASQCVSGLHEPKHGSASATKDTLFTGFPVRVKFNLVYLFLIFIEDLHMFRVSSDNNCSIAVHAHLWCAFLFIELLIGTNMQSSHLPEIAWKNVNKRSYLCMPSDISPLLLPSLHAKDLVLLRGCRCDFCVCLFCIEVDGQMEHPVLQTFLLFLLFSIMLQPGPHTAPVLYKHEREGTFPPAREGGPGLLCSVLPAGMFLVHRGLIGQALFHTSQEVCWTTCISFSGLHFAQHILCANQCREQFLVLFKAV